MRLVKNVAVAALLALAVGSGCAPVVYIPPPHARIRVAPRVQGSRVVVVRPHRHRGWR